MTIKHLVISGGGPTLLQVLGSIKHLVDHNYLNINDIQSVYGTSAGALVGVLISLKVDLDTINDYIINRPWKDLFNVKIDQIFEIYLKKGLFDTKIIEKCLKPLFDSKDISLNITLEELYKYSNIELHFFTFEINEFKIENISYLTHPTLPLITAIQMTCAIPLLVSPVFIDEKCYIDGGVICNYPLKYCIDSVSNEEEILAFKNNYINKDNNVNSESTILNYISVFLFKLIYNLNSNTNHFNINNELIFNTDTMSINTLYSCLNSIDIRKELFLNGQTSAIDYLSKNDLKGSI
jgi:predicted acylesterase/phospholipase RssA